MFKKNAKPKKFSIIVQLLLLKNLKKESGKDKYKHIIWLHFIRLMSGCTNIT